MQKLPALLFLACTHTLILNAQYCNDTRFTEADYFTDADIVTQYNVSYGLADEWFMDYPQPSLNTFDIAYPDPAIDPMEKRPVIVLAHGGGFWGGEKESFAYHLQELAKSGYVVVAVNYRKGWMGSPYDCDGDPGSLELAIYRGMQDVHASLRYLVENANAYGIDTNYIFGGGESAGVYAIMNAYYLTKAEWESFNPGYGYLYGDINYSTNDIDATFKIKAFANMWGGMVDTAFINVNEAVPSIGFYGMSDGVIPYYHGNIQFCDNFAEIYGVEGLADFYDHNGICNIVHQNPLEGHEAYEPEYICANLACFFKSVMCATCTTELFNYDIAACSEDVVIDTTTDTSGETTLIIDNPLETLMPFPNPANERVQVQLDNSWSEHTEAVIMNMAGQQMPVAVYTSGRIRFADISALPEGVYLFSLQDGNRRGTGTFVVTRH